MLKTNPPIFGTNMLLKKIQKSSQILEKQKKNFLGKLNENYLLVFVVAIPLSDV